jgi:hypothetical protein
MLHLSLSSSQLCGNVRTGIYLPDGISTTSVLSALRSAPCIITDGPFADLKLSSREPGHSTVSAEVTSSPEFGGITQVRLLHGETGGVEENVIREERYQAEGRVEFVVSHAGEEGYVRLEASTQTGRRVYTNPVYLSE